MSQVKVSFLDPIRHIEIYREELKPAALARKFLLDGAYSNYRSTLTVEVGDAIGEAAAEEVFDLSNNPSRQDERCLKYGRGPSLSVGDLVEVDGEKYFCASVGWVKL